MQKRDFVIQGQVYKEGVFLGLKELPKLPFINVGRKSFINGWNVFGPELAQLKQEGGKLYLERKGPIKVLGGSLEWRAVKEGLVIYEISTPSPEHSFVSTDSLKFRAKVEGQPSLDQKIAWKSEDGKVDKITSGALKPAEQSNTPDYPKSPSLTPDPPPASKGRKGKLSYKITASVTTGESKQETSVTIEQDELDQVRQEYVDMKKNRLPTRVYFTQNGGPFNTGDYSWAIVSPKMVAGYQIIAENYAPYPAQINSAYRNPVHNKSVGGTKESRHIYGDAVDIRTVAIEHPGAPNEKDWKKLRQAAEKANPSWIEPLKKSKPGHIHADWRPK